MILDRNTLVSQAQALAGAAGSVLSTDTIDLGVARDMGPGEVLRAFFAITTTVAGAGTVTFELISADDAALTSNVTTVGTTAAIPIASLTVGGIVVFPVPRRIGSDTGKRYLGMRYTRSGTLSAGAVTAGLIDHVADLRKYYPIGYTMQ